MSRSERVRPDRSNFYMGGRLAEFEALPYYCYEVDFLTRLSSIGKRSAAQVQKKLTEEQFATLKHDGVVRTETAIYADTAEKVYCERERWIEELRAKRKAAA